MMKLIVLAILTLRLLVHRLEASTPAVRDTAEQTTAATAVSMVPASSTAALAAWEAAVSQSADTLFAHS